MGDLEKKYCGIVNLSYTLAMGPNKVLADMVDNAMKLLVEYKEDESFALNVTMETGLVLKFLDNGDVMQTIQKAVEKMKRAFTDIVSPYDAQPSLSQVEHYRVITKHGDVIRTMKDGQKIVYMRNGNIVTQQNKFIYTINNKGQHY
jgi:hypothetical protein